MKVVASKLSPSLSKCASSSSHGKVHAASENSISLRLSIKIGISFTISRRKTEGFLLLVTTEEASALSLVMQSNEAVPTR